MAVSRAALARLRPGVTLSVAKPFLPLASRRHYAQPPSEEPQKKAQSVIDSIPGNSLVSKTAVLSAGAGLSIFGISNEFLVINEETIVAFSLLSIFYAVGKYGGPMYSDWAKGYAAKVKGIFDAAREDHKSAVKTRIESVNQLGGVIDVTKQLFEVSKETARLEAKAFELEQRTTLVAEAKSVLESWARYEGQVKQREQKELADTVIAKISKELENPKVLQQILQQSVADVEKIIAAGK